MAAEAFLKGHALIVFPEGTRSTPEEKLNTETRCANIAIRAKKQK